jgi:hypothetical protein
MLWLVPPAFAAQLIVVVVGDPAIRILLPASLLLLVPFIGRNWSYRGIRLILVGLLMNLTVICLNGGLMPVSPEAVDAIGIRSSEDMTLGDHISGSKNVMLRSEDTRLSLLADTLITPWPRPYARAVSLGDLVIAAGAVVATAEVLRRASSRLQPEPIARNAAVRP